MIEEIDITPQNSFPQFMGICHGFFEDGQIKWGRIMAVFGFGGALAVYCVEHNLPQLVGNIADWIAVLCDSKFYSFVIDNGGWVRFYYC